MSDRKFPSCKTCKFFGTLKIKKRVPDTPVCLAPVIQDGERFAYEIHPLGSCELHTLKDES